MAKNWVSGLKYGAFKVRGGWCAAAWTSRGLSGLVLPQGNRAAAFQKLGECLPKVPVQIWEKTPEKVPQNLQRQTKIALRGKRFKIKNFDISFLTPYQQRILWAACKIPRGQFRTYGWTTRKAGSPKGFRAAGQALTRNPVPIFIPCHRVIAGGNRLGGYGSGLNWKIKLLKNEGVAVKHGIVS